MFYRIDKYTKIQFRIFKKNKNNNCCKLVDSSKNNRLISCEYTQNIENLFFLYFKNEENRKKKHFMLLVLHQQIQASTLETGININLLIGIEIFALFIGAASVIYIILKIRKKQKTIYLIIEATAKIN